jgi:hypothetical protein
MFKDWQIHCHINVQEHDWGEDPDYSDYADNIWHCVDHCNKLEGCKAVTFLYITKGNPGANCFMKTAAEPLVYARDGGSDRGVVVSVVKPEQHWTCIDDPKCQASLATGIAGPVIALLSLMLSCLNSGKFQRIYSYVHKELGIQDPSKALLQPAAAADKSLACCTTPPCAHHVTMDIEKGQAIVRQQ